MNGSEFRNLWRLAFPMIGTQLLWMSMPVVDNIMVGSLGRDALAALAIAGTFYWFIMVVMMGILNAVNPIVSQLYGAGQSDRYASVLQHGLRVAAVVGLVLFAIAGAGEKFLAFLGQDPRLIPLSGDYLRALMWGLPAQVLFLTFRQFTDGLENPRPTIILVFLAALGNVGLDYAWIHGKWGLPAAGVVGAGYATATMNWFLAIGLGSYIQSRYRAFEPFRYRPFEAALIKEIFKIGIPLAGGMVAELGYFSGSTIMMGWISATATAAHQIALNVASVLFMIPLGLGFATSVRIGMFIGQGNPRAAGEVGRLAFLSATGIGILNGLLLAGLAPEIARLYTEETEILQIAIPLLYIGGLFQIFDGLQAVGIQSLRGLKDTRRPFLMALVAFWGAGIPLSGFLAFPLEMGPMGYWFGMILSLGLAACFHILRFRARIKQLIPR